MIKKLKQKIMAAVSRPFQKEDNKDYPQTWYFMPLNWFPRRFLQTLCGILGGHEISETEWAYGGKYVCVNCRWCDKSIEITSDQALDLFPDSEFLRDTIKKWRKITNVKL